MPMNRRRAGQPQTSTTVHGPAQGPLPYSEALRRTWPASARAALARQQRARSYRPPPPYPRNRVHAQLARGRGPSLRPARSYPARTATRRPPRNRRTLWRSPRFWVRLGALAAIFAVTVAALSVALLIAGRWLHINQPAGLP